MYHHKLFLILVFCVHRSALLSYSNRRKEVTSVTGTVGQLPCYVNPADDVALILWFKESNGTPIYTFDARDETEPVRHSPVRNELGLRLHFRVPSKTLSSPSGRPPALLIRNLKSSDSGSYRCRIDYRNSPTTNHVIRLHVIQPPTRLEIQALSESGPISDQEMSGAGSPGATSNEITYMGPYIEGQNVSILCTAFGGLPFPEVLWYRNESVVDGSFSVTGNESVANELVIVSLDRTHSHDLFTCRASNNNETKPISHRVNVDVYSRVKHIEVDAPDQMTAGVQYNLTCRTRGAYPAVKVEFWKLQDRIGGSYQSKGDEHASTYTIPFVPEASDHEALITCKAENPWIPQNFMEAGRKLNVVYTPVAVLRFGSTARGNFSEGESVLLECHAKANPPLHSITWFHKGKQLTDNVAAGIHLNGMTLVLRYLKYASAGGYACEVSNKVGKKRSNTLRLQLSISPKCSSSTEEVIPLAVGESCHLNCSILAWPPDLNFYWTLNRSGGILPLSSVGQIIKLNLTEDEVRRDASAHRQNPFGAKVRLDSKNSDSASSLLSEDLEHFREEALERNKKSSKRGESDVEFDRIFHQSRLLYRVTSQLDYGLVGCWARNSYAKQISPCLFRIVPHTDDSASTTSATEMNLTVSKPNWDDESAASSQQGIGALLRNLQWPYGLLLIGLLVIGMLIFLLGCVCAILYFRSHTTHTVDTQT